MTMSLEIFLCCCNQPTTILLDDVLGSKCFLSRTHPNYMKFFFFASHLIFLLTSTWGETNYYAEKKEE
jgi:hypothetical protein